MAKGGLVFAVEGFGETHQIARELHDPGGVVGPADRQAAHAQVRSAHRAHFLDTGLFCGLVARRHQVGQQGQRLALAQALVQFLQAGEFGEHHGDIGELLGGFLVAFHALGHGAGRQDVQQEFQVLPALFLQFSLLLGQVLGHLVENPGQLAELILRFHPHLHPGFAGTQPAGPFLELFQRFDQVIGADQS
jgi:hypothetical protein